VRELHEGAEFIARALVFVFALSVWLTPCFVLVLLLAALLSQGVFCIKCTKHSGENKIRLCESCTPPPQSDGKTQTVRGSHTRPSFSLILLPSLLFHLSVTGGSFTLLLTPRITVLQVQVQGGDVSCTDLPHVRSFRGLRDVRNESSPDGVRFL
jgi:hypothetical protein